jgi:hypothetical protein
MDDFDEALQRLREKPQTRWIAEQLAEVIAQGVSMARNEPSMESALANESSVTDYDRNKRATYQSSRAYTGHEKADLLMKAVHAVLVELPAIQLSAIERFRKLGSQATDIEFVPPPIEEGGAAAVEQATPHSINIATAVAEQVLYSKAYQELTTRVAHDNSQ